MGNAYLDTNKPRRAQFREPRRAKPTGCVEIHTAESVMDTVGPDTGAESVAKFIQGRNDPGSYHRLVDSDSIVSLVRFGCEAYGDGTGSNPWAIHISAACRTTDWEKMSKERRTNFIANLAKAANEARIWLKRTHGVDLPARRISKAQSDKGVAGFLGHGDRDPGRRTDPGADFPWGEFMAAYTALSKPTKIVKPARPVGDKNQGLRRAILASEVKIKAAAREADKVGKKSLAKAYRARAAAYKVRRISLRVKKK